MSLAILDAALCELKVVCFFNKLRYFGFSIGSLLLFLIQYFNACKSSILFEIREGRVSWSDEKLGKNAIFFLEKAASTAVVQPLCRKPSLASSQGLTSPW